MEKLSNIHDDVTDIKTRLYGNGQPGLIKTVEANKNWIRAWTKGLWLFVAALVTTLVPAALGLLYWIVMYRDSATRAVNWIAGHSAST